MKMDKTVFDMHKKEFEPTDYLFWQSKTIKERLEAAAYLNSIAYNYDINNPPKMDKTIFTIFKRVK